MPSGFKKEKSEPLPEPIESTPVEEPVTEPLAEPEQCGLKPKPLSDDVIANVLAVLGKAYDAQEIAQAAVGAPGCNYFMHKSEGYNSLQLRQVGTQWAWLAV